jgi:hypothetical protein
MFIFWLKAMYSKKLLSFQILTSGPFKLDSDQYGEARERGVSAFGKESILLEPDPEQFPDP